MKSLPRFFAHRRAPAFASRRDFLGPSAGAASACLRLAGLLQEQGFSAGRPRPHRPIRAIRSRRDPVTFRPRPSSVIWLFMNGGPSQVDTWDYKPELAKRDGQELKGFDKNTGFFTDQVGPLMKSPFKFAQHGQCGDVGLGDLSRTWPSTSTTWPSSTRAGPTSNNHSPALFKINTGMTPHGLSLRRLLGDLRPGQREPEPAGVRRHVRHAGPRAAQGQRVRTGARASCRASTRARRSSRKGAPIDNLYRGRRT